MKSQCKLSIIALLVSSFCQNIYAKTTPDRVSKIDKKTNVERITVTATRKETLDTDLAMSIHGVGKDEMGLDNGQHVAESLNSISGVLINQLSGGQGHKAAIRMPINTSGYYLYLQDNVPLQSPAFFNHNALWWSSFNSNVARMEVLKGAGTALYGSGAVAATINIISAPVAEEPVTSLDVMLGEFQYSKIQMSHSNKIDDKNGFRISGSYLNNDGWRDHIASERLELNLRHEYEISPQESLITTFNVSDLEQEMAARLNDDKFENDRTDSGLSDEVLASDPLRKTQYMRLAVQWDKTVGDKLYSLIPYLRYRTNDYTATWNQNMPKVESNVITAGLLGLANLQHSSNSETTVGFDLEFTEGDQLSYQPLDFETTGWRPDTYMEGEKFYDDTTRYLSISPYFQHKRALSDKLDLTLGARYDYAKYDFDNHLDVYGDIGHGNISLENRSDDFSHLSPKASLNYHLSDDSSLYARYANSFRIPTAGSLYHLTTKDSSEPKPVDPEVSDTFEVGYKTNLENITFDAAIYYMDVDDGIVRAYNDEGQRYLTNASRIIHKGIEAAIDWLVTTEFNISLAYSKSKHEFDEHEQYSGNEMAMAPDYIANLRLRYAPSYLQGFSSMLEVQSIGEYWMDDANSSDPDTGEARIYNGYTIVNLKARYQVSPQLALNARMLNLSDKVYAQEAQFRYSRNSWSPGAPRTIYIGLNYQW